MVPRAGIRRLLEFARLGTWDYDLTASLYLGDDRCKELFGVPEVEALTPRKVLEIIHPDDRARVEQAAVGARAPESDGYYETEYRVVWPDSSVHWVYARGQAYFSRRGKERHVVRFSGVVMDLDQIKAADESLRESEVLFRTVFEHAGVGIGLIEIDGRWLRVNRRLEEILGFSSDELQRTTCHQLTCPEDLDQDRREKELLIQGEKESYTTEKRYIHALGHEIWVKLTVSLVRAADGTPRYFVKAVDDITDRRRALQALIQSEERLELALTSMRGGYWDMVLDPESPTPFPDEIYLSPHLKASLGFDDDDMSNAVTAWHSRIHPDDLPHIQAASLDHIDGKTPLYEVEYRFMRKDGSWAWIDGRGRVVRDQEGRPVRWVGVDIEITKRKELEEELKAARDAAERANQAKSEFLGNISHELRTPMTVILGSMELLSRLNVDPTARELLDMGANSAGRLMALINDLLDISRIEAGRVEIKAEPFDLRECVRLSVEMFSKATHDKGLRLHWRCAPSIPREVVGDVDRVGQVLINLVGNAVKFTPQGEVEVVVERDGEELVFSVRDTGIGADSEVDLFERFTQADSTNTRQHGGAGLGLSISKGLVELMQGRIWMRSEKGKGSTFTFTIPFRLPA